MTLQTMFIGLWICLFVSLCFAIANALRQRNREVRRARRRSFSRFTGVSFGHRRSQRRASVTMAAVAS